MCAGSIAPGGAVRAALGSHVSRSPGSWIPLTSTVYVNDPTHLTGMGALLDRLMADEGLRGTDTVADDRDR